jgi:hypothetical protein
MNYINYFNLLNFKIKHKLQALIYWLVKSRDTYNNYIQIKIYIKVFVD